MPGPRASQHAIEITQAITAVGRISQDAVEVLQARPTPSPTTPTGAGISQDAVEVLIAATVDARVSHVVVELLMSAAAGGEGGAVGGGSSTMSYGFVT